MACQRSPERRVNVHCRKAPSDNVDVLGIAELGEELFTVFPGEAEGAYVCDANPGYGVAYGREMRWGEFARPYKAAGAQADRQSHVEARCGLKVRRQLEVQV